MLYGTSDSEPQTDYVVAQLSQELYNSNLLLLLIQVSFSIECNLHQQQQSTEFACWSNHLMMSLCDSDGTSPVNRSFQQ